jgi:hypothetical protein
MIEAIDHRSAALATGIHERRAGFRLRPVLNMVTRLAPRCFLQVQG